MIGLDTNVIVRYLAQDDPRQSPRAGRLVDSFTTQAPGYLSILTLIETVWVLEDLYARTRPDIAAIVTGLLETQGLVVQSRAVVWQSLQSFSDRGADFADHLIAALGEADGCAKTVTFDKAAARHAGMQLLDASA